MSSASSASVLLNEMEQAEKDLALYAAIIGCKPTVDPTAAPVVAPEPPECESLDAPAEPRRLVLWMRQVSDEAKRRIHEAAMRLAS